MNIKGWLLHKGMNQPLYIPRIYTWKVTPGTLTSREVFRIIAFERPWSTNTSGRTKELLHSMWCWSAIFSSSNYTGMSPIIYDCKERKRNRRPFFSFVSIFDYLSRASLLAFDSYIHPMCSYASDSSLTVDKRPTASIWYIDIRYLVIHVGLFVKFNAFHEKFDNYHMASAEDVFSTTPPALFSEEDDGTGLPSPFQPTKPCVSKFIQLNFIASQFLCTSYQRLWAKN